MALHSPTSATAPHVLVVRPGSTAARTTRLLARAGYRVETADSFEEAITQMDGETPSLLIADVRLGAVNGLHLVHRRHHRSPELPSIVTHAVPDPVLADEAQRVGAAFLVEADVPDTLLSLVSHLLEPTGGTRS